MGTGFARVPINSQSNDWWAGLGLMSLGLILVGVAIALGG
jgi:hypothetical protein